MNSYPTVNFPLLLVRGGRLRTSSPLKQIIYDRQKYFLHAASVLAALVFSASSEAANITYETRALTGTDGPLGPRLGSGVRFTSFNAPVINDAGQTAFSGRLTGTGVTNFLNDNGIWSERGGLGLNLLARAGNQAPGTAAAVNFKSLDAPVLNGAGQTAFVGDLTGTGVGGNNDYGIWSESSGSGMALLAREGSQAPGVAAGVNFSDLSSLVFTDAGLVFNNAGQVAFLGRLAGTGVSSINDYGIWSEGGGSGLALLAREGSQAPGMATNVSFTSLRAPVLNSAGQAAFFGTISGPGVPLNGRSIWSQGGGAGLALIAKDGDHAPGTSTGVNFSGFGDPVLNNAGQVAFWGGLTGTGVTSSNNSGVWSGGGVSGVTLIARSGDPAPGTGSGVRFSTFDDPVLNGAGQTAFFGDLTGTGVTNGINSRGIWSEGGGLGLALVARTGDPAPGTTAGVKFNGFYYVGIDGLLLNGAGQMAFLGSLSGPGVDFSNNLGVWATDPNGLLQLIARAGDLFDVSNDPLNPDLRTIASLSFVVNSGGQDSRGTSFNDAGQLALLLYFSDGSGGIFVATIAGPSVSPLKLTITRATTPANGYDFAWGSRPGKVYDLVTSTDLASPIPEWPVHASYGNIPATGATTTLTAVPVDGQQRFFAVIEKDAPAAD